MWSPEHATAAAITGHHRACSRAFCMAASTWNLVLLTHIPSLHGLIALLPLLLG
jgi:hypothetical protein